MILVLAAVLSLGSLPQVTNIDAVVRQLPSLQAVAGSLGGGHVQIQIIVDLLVSRFYVELLRQAGGLRSI